MNDLSADLSAELAGPRPVAAPVPPRRTVPAVSVVFTPLHWARPSVAAPAAARRPIPAVSLVFTPLHWARPSVAAPPAGAGVVLRGGPWQVDVLL